MRYWIGTAHDPTILTLHIYPRRLALAPSAARHTRCGKRPSTSSVPVKEYEPPRSALFFAVYDASLHIVQAPSGGVLRPLSGRYAVDGSTAEQDGSNRFPPSGGARGGIFVGVITAPRQRRVAHTTGRAERGASRRGSGCQPALPVPRYTADGTGRLRVAGR
jgi:hypothetical protein